VFLYVPSWRWDSLPSSYLESAYLCADTNILTQSPMLGVSVNKDVLSDAIAVPVIQGNSGGDLDCRSESCNCYFLRMRVMSVCAIIRNNMVVTHPLSHGAQRGA